MCPSLCTGSAFIQQHTSSFVGTGCDSGSGPSDHGARGSAAGKHPYHRAARSSDARTADEARAHGTRGQFCQM